MCLLILAACSGNKGQKENIANDLEKIDSQKGEFNPGYINDPNNSHIAVSVTFANNQFALLPAAATVRPGKPPYNGDTSKTFVVKFKDAASKYVSGYSFLNPGLLRACDGKNPEISFRDSITFEILVPNNRSISNVEITTKGKLLTSFQLPPIRPNTDTSTTKPQ